MVFNQLERVVDLFANIDRGNLLMRAPTELKQVAYQFSHPVDFGGHNFHGMKFLFILAMQLGEDEKKLHAVEIVASGLLSSCATLAANSPTVASREACHSC